MQFDTIIIGGGSAGSVLASRLFEDPANGVLLIEAGIDTPPHDVPDVIGSGDPEYSYFDPRYHWENFRVHYRSYAEALAGRDPALTDWVRASAWSSWHPAGTCKMGIDSDPMAVLDASCRVRGVAGLRVADASIMPTIVSANTNIPTIMIGERVADAIRRGE